MFKKIIEGLAGVVSSSPKEPVDIDLGLKAYDLSLDAKVDPLLPAVAGWCFGVPPGISPSEWPLDPESGYPMQHGFTLKLPRHFQVCGPGIVAVSFFGPAYEHTDGGPTITEGLDGIVRNPLKRPPSNSDLRALWSQGKTAHKRLHRMTDILGCHYAAIPLSTAEFQGAPCPVPDTANNAYLQQTVRPRWLKIGSAGQLFEQIKSQSALFPIEDDFRYRFLGGEPEMRVDFCMPIILTPREADPNAGRSPQDIDVVSPYKSDFQMEDWAKGLGSCHLGGTMFANQSTPRMSPHYIEFEGHFGNFNFGNGNAQLDLKTFCFSWDC